MPPLFMKVEILCASYGTLDVTLYLKNLVDQGIFQLKVRNETFGSDPNPGTPKMLAINYKIDGHLFCVEQTENTDFNFFTRNYPESERLGIYYTNNSKPAIIKATLDNLLSIWKQKNIDIIVCGFTYIPGYPFHWVESLFKESSHPNIKLMICQCLAKAQQLGRYRFVSFLEHDVLYPSDYFDYPDISSTYTSIMNSNYIGVTKQGYEAFIGNFNVLSQYTCHFDFAVKHFFDSFRSTIETGDGPLEPYARVLTYQGSSPSIHINEQGSFTQHAACFSHAYYPYSEYWGYYQDVMDLIDPLT